MPETPYFEELAGQIDFEYLAKTYGTPLWVYDEATIIMRCNELKNAIKYKPSKIRYAAKANDTIQILKLVKDEGLGIDSVSIFEVMKCGEAGFNTEDILFTGENASYQTLNYLKENNILVNIGSFDQLEAYGKMSPGAKVSFRINPGEGHGHSEACNTGGPSSKHGEYLDTQERREQLDSLLKMYDLTLIGAHSHIGSGSDFEHLDRISNKTLNIARKIDNLDNVNLEFVNLGGGIPVPYKPDEERFDLKKYGALLGDKFESLSQDLGKEIRLEIEPGRYIIAESCFLLAQVTAVKQTPKYNFIILDTGFNHLVRPAMYGSYHPIKVLNNNKATQPTVVGGYCCESGDVFTQGEGGILEPRMLPVAKRGDLVIIGVAGAYGKTMRSNYNSMPGPASVKIGFDGTDKEIVRRENFNDLIRRDIF